jgi:isoleucyl-tRNA synthetase
MDRLYRDLNGITQKETAHSVHLTDFPVADESLINTNLQNQTELAQTVTSLIFSLRKKANIKVRQPLPKAIIPVANPTMRTQLLAVTELIKSEVNIKVLELLDPKEVSHLLVKTIKPNFKLLGPKYGQQMKVVANAITAMDGAAIDSIESEGSYELTIEGQQITIGLDDVEIQTQDIPGWTVAADKGVTVALDLTLTPELLSEGTARELVNRLQTIRKEQNLKLTDRIAISIQAPETIQTQITANQTYICEETLANSLVFTDDLKEGVTVDIDGLEVLVRLGKA